MTNEQKKEWFLRLNPNGRIPTLVDNTQSPPFAVIETSAQLLYLLKFADKEDKFGFKDELERNEALQWMFFWHGGGAPYQGQVNHFSRAAPEKIPCKSRSTKLIPPIDRFQTPSTATKTKPSVSTACSRFVCPVNTATVLAIGLLAPARVNTPWQILRLGRG
jgi:glutathione S-transferase